MPKKLKNKLFQIKLVQNITEQIIFPELCNIKTGIQYIFMSNLSAFKNAWLVK